MNLSAAFHAGAAALPNVQERDCDRIVNTASAHGLFVAIEKAAYVSIKHRIIGITRATVLDNAEANITCNAVLPLWLLAQLIQEQINRQAEEIGVDTETATPTLLQEKESSLRFTWTEDIAAAAMFISRQRAQHDRELPDA